MKISFAIPIFLFLLLRVVSNAQQIPALIKVDGLGGSGDESIASIGNAANSFTIAIYSSSPNDGNINSACGTTSKVVYRNYNRNNATLNWEKCMVASYSQSIPCLDNQYNAFFGINSNNGRDIQAAVYDASDNIYWLKSWGGITTEFFRNAVQTKDSGFVIVAESYSNDGDVGAHYGSMFFKDVWVFKIDKYGTLVWSKVFGGSYDDQMPKIAVNNNNDIFIAATTESADYDCTTSHGGQDILVIKLDSAGNTKWTKCYGGSGNELVYGGIKEDGKGGAYIAAESNSKDYDIADHKGDIDCWVFHIDSTGALKWAKSTGMSGRHYVPYSIEQTTDGYLWIGGTTGFDAFIIKIDTLGNTVAQKIVSASDVCTFQGLVALDNNMLFGAGKYAAVDVNKDWLPSKSYGKYDVFCSIIANWNTGIGAIITESSDVQIFPVPVKDFINITLATSTILDIEVYDVIGNKILQHNNFNSQKEKLDVSRLTTGTYLIILRENGTQFIKRFVRM